MQYLPGSPASVVIVSFPHSHIRERANAAISTQHDMGYDTKNMDVTWLVSSVNQSNTIS